MQLFKLPLFSAAVFFLGATLFGCSHAPIGTDSADVERGLASGERLGRLDWGKDPSTGRVWSAHELRRLNLSDTSEIGISLRQLVRHSMETRGREARPIPAIQVEGILYSDPRYRRSEESLRAVQDILNWSLCARVANEPEGKPCREKAFREISNWIQVNHPTGNPINDSTLLALILAVDLLVPIAEPPLGMAATEWVREFIRKGDAFYASIPETDGRFRNNWQTWRLGLRALAAVVVEDKEAFDRSRELLSQHLSSLIASSGAMVDFTVRDAMHYQIYGLVPLVQLALFAPEALTGVARNSLESALLFVRPYFTGEKVHIEFKRSTVPFDIQRREAGDPDFQNAPWDPKKARWVLRPARCVFTSIRSWTGSLVDGNYDPADRAIYALHEGRVPPPK